MDDDKLVKRVVNEMIRYVEGSSSGEDGLWLTINDSKHNYQAVAWFRNRDERNAQLLWKNANAVIEGYQAALADAGMVIMPKQEPKQKETFAEEVARLQREIGQRQSRLQYLVCGDPRVRVTVPISPELSVSKENER